MAKRNNKRGRKPQHTRKQRKAARMAEQYDKPGTGAETGGGSFEEYCPGAASGLTAGAACRTKRANPERSAA